MKPATTVFLLIEDIYKAVGDAARWKPVLRSFQQVLDSPACAIGRFDFDRRVGSIDHAVGIDDEYCTTYRDRFAALNPWLAREECFRCEGAVWSGRDLAEHRTLVTSEFYRDWLKPQDLFHASFGVLRWTGVESVHFVALRPPAASPFERRELDAYGLYMPHLRQAVALAERLGSLGPSTPRKLDELVGEAAGAVMLLDGEEHMIAASHGAEALLARGKPFRVGRHGLRVAHDRDHAAFEGQLAAAMRVARGVALTPGEAVALHDGTHGPLGTSVVPLPAGALPGQERPAVALIADGPVPDEDCLRQLYGLTAAEARLALRLARGQSMQQAAKSLDIAITTARTHLQRVYGKTRTRRQSELVALLLGAGQPSTD